MIDRNYSQDITLSPIEPLESGRKALYLAQRTSERASPPFFAAAHAVKVRALGLLVLVVSLVLLTLSSWLATWDARLTDHWYRDPSRKLKLDERICLILIDDRSLEQLKTPLTFWAPHFSRVTSSLIEAGVAAVGLDWLPYDLDARLFEAMKPFYPELKGVEGNPWLPLLEAISKRSANPMVQGIYPPNLQGQTPSGMLEQYRPAAELMGMLEAGQMGFLNLSRDRDAVLRRQAILPLQLKQPLWGSLAYPPFAARLAEVASNQALDIKNPRWQGQPLPLAGDGTVRLRSQGSNGAPSIEHSACDSGEATIGSPSWTVQPKSASP